MSFKPITWVKAPFGSMAICDADPENLHLLNMNDCGGYTKDGELYVYCEKHDHFVHLEKVDDEEAPIESDKLRTGE
ncbi:MAG: hypothetical protein ACTSRU_19855 [Candidatus Hodarchaeales archaeon]